MHASKCGANASSRVLPYMQRYEWLVVALVVVSLVGALVWLPM